MYCNCMSRIKTIVSQFQHQLISTRPRLTVTPGRGAGTIFFLGGGGGAKMLTCLDLYRYIFIIFIISLFQTHQ